MEIFPQNGRVLIIDNQIEQAKPLMKILSKNRVKYSYFIGDSSDKPDNPMQDIRLVFLDLQLRPPATTPNPNDDVKHDIKILKDLISKNNSLYILLIWSKNLLSDLGDLIKTGIGHETDLPQPLKIIDLDKNEYFEIDAITDKMIPKGEEKEILKKIQDEINSQISAQHFFHIFFYWDNIINKSSNEIINSISKADEDPEINNKKIWSLIYNLAEARSGQKNDPNDYRIIRNSLLTFNGAFFDSVETNLINTNYPCPLLPQDQIIAIDDSFKAKINKKLLTVEEDLKCEPGTVYYDTDDAIKNSIINDGINRDTLCDNFCDSLSKKRDDIFETGNKVKREYKEQLKTFENSIKDAIKDNSSLILCEVTPSCDYAQNKNKMNRVIHGVTWPLEFAYLIPNNSNYLYKSAKIEIRGGLFNLLFDFRYFHSKQEDDFSSKTPVLRLRHEILVDIQSRLAAHVHRPGVTSL